MSCALQTWWRESPEFQGNPLLITDITDSQGVYLCWFGLLKASCTCSSTNHCRSQRIHSEPTKLEHVVQLHSLWSHSRTPTNIKMRGLAMAVDWGMGSLAFLTRVQGEKAEQDSATTSSASECSSLYLLISAPRIPSANWTHYYLFISYPVKYVFLIFSWHSSLYKSPNRRRQYDNV